MSSISDAMNSVWGDVFSALESPWVIQNKGDFEKPNQLSIVNARKVLRRIKESGGIPPVNLCCEPCGGLTVEFPRIGRGEWICWTFYNGGRIECDTWCGPKIIHSQSWKNLRCLERYFREKVKKRCGADAMTMTEASK